MQIVSGRKKREKIWTFLFLSLFLSFVFIRSEENKQRLGSKHSNKSRKLTALVGFVRPLTWITTPSKILDDDDDDGSLDAAADDDDKKGGGCGAQRPALYSLNCSSSLLTFIFMYVRKSRGAGAEVAGGAGAGAGGARKGDCRLSSPATFLAPLASPAAPPPPPPPSPPPRLSLVPSIVSFFCFLFNSPRR